VAERRDQNDCGGWDVTRVEHRSVDRPAIVRTERHESASSGSIARP